jgi:hypothetical protein
MKIIKVSQFKRDDIPGIIEEIYVSEEIMNYISNKGIGYDEIEAIASHISITDTDYEEL